MIAQHSGGIAQQQQLQGIAQQGEPSCNSSILEPSHNTQAASCSSSILKPSHNKGEPSRNSSSSLKPSHTRVTIAQQLQKQLHKPGGSHYTTASWYHHTTGESHRATKANTQQQTEAAVTVKAKLGNKYCVRYLNNNSKRWDGREIWIDLEFMEALYNPSMLIPGFEVSLPWKGKTKTTYWNAVIIDPTTSKLFKYKL